RLVVVEDADDFVTDHRSGLEKYVDKPARKSVLVLDVKTWMKTTRLAKAVVATGLDIECSPIKGAQLVKWLQDASRDHYGQTLSRDAASLLVELVGDDLGFLDQELSKLASYVGSGGTIEAKDVQSLVGGWKTETTWAMTDAVRDGNLGLAIEALDQLLMAGEPGPKLLGGISSVFKKLAVATELAKGQSLDQSLKEAGVFPMAIGASTAFLRRVGRAKAERILSMLIETESGLKGGVRLPERIQLESLLLKLAGK
ncbi:MAG: DNA polymerase III subunit delta, partial [Planctomycetes bacterium]|nr:DNA polymerase III subunit delta [Planctomycetota bacterium]